jgi:hypothetical protein
MSKHDDLIRSDHLLGYRLGKGTQNHFRSA